MRLLFLLRRSYESETTSAKMIILIHPEDLYCTQITEITDFIYFIADYNNGIQ